jgi:transketolase C-terminal domain/subunit
VKDGPLWVRKGATETALVATGSVLSVALEAANHLESVYGLSPSVFSCPLITSVSDGFFDSLTRFKYLITLEEHIDSGGLGELLAVICGQKSLIVKISLSNDAVYRVGSQSYLRKCSGLFVDRVVEIFLSIEAKK